MPEAPLRPSKNGLVVDGDGWFIVNARDSRWKDEGPLGAYCNFVQGVNGPTGYGHVAGTDSGGRASTYQVGPPALWGIEFHYKFD